MDERMSLRSHLERYGMTIAWLTDEGFARLNGTPSNPYFEPYPGRLRSDARNRIPIFEVMGHGKLVFSHALMDQIVPVRAGVADFFRAPFTSTVVLFIILCTKLVGSFSEIQSKSEMAISIEEHNRASVAEFPFDQPLQFCGGSLTHGTFRVQEVNGRTWLLDTALLTNVNLIQFEP